MTDKKSDDPKVKKLSINDESVQELTDSETEEVVGGMAPRGARFLGKDEFECGDTGTFLSTCTKVDTGTVVPTTEKCAR